MLFKLVPWDVYIAILPGSQENEKKKKKSAKSPTRPDSDNQELQCRQTHWPERFVLPAAGLWSICDCSRSSLFVRETCGHLPDVADIMGPQHRQWWSQIVIDSWRLVFILMLRSDRRKSAAKWLCGDCLPSVVEETQRGSSSGRRVKCIQEGCVCVCVCVFREDGAGRGGGGVSESQTMAAFGAVTRSLLHWECRQAGHSSCNGRGRSLVVFFFWPPPPFSPSASLTIRT